MSDLGDLFRMLLKVGPRHLKSQAAELHRASIWHLRMGLRRDAPHQVQVNRGQMRHDDGRAKKAKRESCDRRGATMCGGNREECGYTCEGEHAEKGMWHAGCCRGKRILPENAAPLPGAWRGGRVTGGSGRRLRGPSCSEKTKRGRGLAGAAKFGVRVTWGVVLTSPNRRMSVVMGGVGRTLRDGEWGEGVRW